MEPSQLACQQIDVYMSHFKLLEVSMTIIASL